MVGKTETISPIYTHPAVCGKWSSTKPVLCSKKIGDCCPQHLLYLPLHESKQLIVASKYHHFSPYPPYACRTQCICTQISIADILWMIYKIDCRKVSEVSTPENHLNKLLRKQDIIKSNWKFRSHGIWQISPCFASWKKNCWFDDGYDNVRRWWCSSTDLLNKNCQVPSGTFKKLKPKSQRGTGCPDDRSHSPGRAGMAELTQWLWFYSLFSIFLLTIRWPFSLVISVNLSLSTFSPVPLALYNV